MESRCVQSGNATADQSQRPTFRRDDDDNDMTDIGMHQGDTSDVGMLTVCPEACAGLAQESAEPLASTDNPSEIEDIS